MLFIQEELNNYLFIYLIINYAEQLLCTTETLLYISWLAMSADVLARFRIPNV